MSTIALSKGFVTLVDDEDHDWLSQFRWCVMTCRTSGPYAVRGVKAAGKSRLIMMHRAILDPPDGMIVDHINRNSLDNRRANLRICTHGQNMANGTRKPPRETGFRGVEYQRGSAGKWFYVRALIDGKRVYVGRFPTAEEAARVASKYRKERFGEFAAPEFLVE